MDWARRRRRDRHHHRQRGHRPRRGYYYDDYAYDGPYYYPSGYTGDPRAVCAENFRSFEWRTGLYTTHAGEKRLCPYLK